MYAGIQKPPSLRMTERGRGKPRYHLNLFLPSQGGTSSGTWGECRSRAGVRAALLQGPCMPHRCNGRTPLSPGHSLIGGGFENTAPGMYSTDLSPPSRTNRRFSGRVRAVYLFPLVALLGDIINLRLGFVKGFSEIYIKIFESFWDIYGSLPEYTYGTAYRRCAVPSHCRPARSFPHGAEQKSVDTF
jgi:hypothetical protein